ncbi:hypothetical protein [Piscinibacter sakaiensis]|uniref:Uncharacterized protein n=1 Tax=Piscinibacter sakaiensis TaxID=1547922 RepID=A0A0K8P1Q0_PISS1|nr:hypothetical protein [Piscinibacter sakaiensis]GAP36548.1 hypothetical protein ISF6_2388 [Piscinibacter sakaiensis]
MSTHPPRKQRPPRPARRAAGPALAAEAGLPEEAPSAMPEGHGGIRITVGDDEPPAVLFHAQAAPGALVSWAWSQLVTLDTFLDAAAGAGEARGGAPDIAGAARAVLGPVIAALAFSEQRAHALQQAAELRQAAPAGRRRAARRG